MSQDDSESRTIAEGQSAERRSDFVSENSQSVEIIAAYWEGPLPPPVALGQYEDVLPGSAERIMRMTEAQAEHRIQQERNASQREDDRVQIEKTAVVADSRRGYIGLIFGFVISLIIISVGAYIAVSVQPWVGASIIGGNIAGLAWVFVHGTNTRRRERERKAADRDP